MTTVFNTWFPSAKTGHAVYNVKGYGAVGNEVADDTAAIQSAIDTAIDAGGGTVYFPVGKYKVTGELNFTRAQSYTGNRLVHLLGEKGVDELSGSIIRGSVSGFIIQNSNIVTASISGTVGVFSVGDLVTHGAFQAVVLSVSAGTLTWHNVDGTWTDVPYTLTDTTSGATTTVNTINVPRWSVSRVESLCIINTSTTTGTGVARIEGVQTASIVDCYFKGMQGLNTSDQSYIFSIKDCFFSAPGGHLAGSYGVVCGQVNISNCNFIGWDIAILHSGFGGLISGCRFEVNNTAIRTGTDETLNSHTSTDLHITACQTEQCNTDIYFHTVNACSITSCGLTGTVAVDGVSERTVCIDISAATDCFIAGVACSGRTSSAMVIIGGSSETNLTLVSVLASNSGSGGNWSISLGTVDTVECINCNNSSIGRAFADLPTAVVAGSRNYITNCSTGTQNFMDIATASSSTGVKRPVIYDGTNWRVG